MGNNIGGALLAQPVDLNSAPDSGVVLPLEQQRHIVPTVSAAHWQHWGSQALPSLQIQPLDDRVQDAKR